MLMAEIVPILPRSPQRIFDASDLKLLHLISQVFVHAGPFANIAHGNSSIIADKVQPLCLTYSVGDECQAASWFNCGSSSPSPAFLADRPEAGGRERFCGD